MELAPARTSGMHFLFRGHASTSFALLSMVGRKPHLYGNLLDSERQCFNEFKELIQEENWQKFKIKNYNDNMYYMSIGRHLGLDCRLLDWSASYETALYFAAFDKKRSKEDGHLWVMCYENDIDDSNAKIDPFHVNSFTLVKECFWSEDDLPINNYPLGIVRRFYQNGFFSILPSYQLTTPLDELDLDNVHFIHFTITASAKEDIRNYLQRDSNYLHLTKPSEIEEHIKVINAKYFSQ